MHFDDRLATVLRHRATGEAAARTQFRQLIDLLGERPQAGNPGLKAAAYLRLIALGEQIPLAMRARIVGETGWRFRNPELVRWFGGAAPALCAAALYRAQLGGDEWEELIPTLPVRARGFLRHRDDLPLAAVRMLDRLGVQDRALPLPELALTVLEETGGLAVEEAPSPEHIPPTPEDDLEPLVPLSLGAANDSAEEPEPEQAPEAQPEPEPASAAPTNPGIRALVDRIEAFRAARADRSEAPRLPLEDTAPPASAAGITQFLFGTDTDGRIDWADPAIAPMVVGSDLAAIPEAGPRDLPAAIHRRQPVRQARFALRGAPAIEGEWLVDAAPSFTRSEGRFNGYVGRFRRAVETPVFDAAREADRIRQLLHELRTPVNAIQMGSEMIQQQIAGPVPHEYRAIAATVAGDAARMLAGFDEMDRLAKLETGAIDLEPGEADLAAIARTQVSQLQSVLSPRVARIDADWRADSIPLPLDRAEAEKLVWRILASLAGSTAAGETLGLVLEAGEDGSEMALDLPASLRKAEDIFASETRGSGSGLSSGIFGAGFALRLARAEARAAGGDLTRTDDRLVLSLPPLTALAGNSSPAVQNDRAAG